MQLVGSACLAAFYREELSGRKTWWKLVGGNQWRTRARRPGSVGSSSEPRSPEPPCCIAVRPTIGQVEQPGGRTPNNQKVAVNTCEGTILKAGQEDHEVQCHNLPSLVTASVHLDFQVRRQMNPFSLTSGGNDFPIYGPGRACGQ